MMTSIDRIASGEKRIADPKLARRIRKVIFRLFLANAARQAGEKPVWRGVRNGLICQFADGSVMGDSRLSNAYFNLLF